MTQKNRLVRNHIETVNSGSEGKARVGLGTGVSKARTCRSRTGVQWALYLEVPAVCREVHLNDEAGNVFAVADSVKGGAQC